MLQHVPPWKLAANVIKEKTPEVCAKGPLSVYARAMETFRLLQIEVAVRADRALAGWVFGTFGYNGDLHEDTPWERMPALGLQSGNTPRVPVGQTCNTTESDPDFAVCRQNLRLLFQQWLNEEALADLDTRGGTTLTTTSGWGGIGSPARFTSLGTHDGGEKREIRNLDSRP